MSKKINTLHNRILFALLERKEISTWYICQGIRTTRPAKNINELKNNGYNIKGRWITKGIIWKRRIYVYFMTTEEKKNHVIIHNILKSELGSF